MQVSKKSHPKKLLLNCQLNISGQDPCSTAFFVNKHITTSYQLSASNSHNITMIFLSSSTCLHLIALVHTYSCRETFLVHSRNSQRCYRSSSLYSSYDQSELDSRCASVSYYSQRNICLEFDRMRYLL